MQLLHARSLPSQVPSTVSPHANRQTAARSLPPARRRTHAKRSGQTALCACCYWGSTKPSPCADPCARDCDAARSPPPCVPLPVLDSHRAGVLGPGRTAPVDRGRKARVGGRAGRGRGKNSALQHRRQQQHHQICNFLSLHSTLAPASPMISSDILIYLSLNLCFPQIGKSDP